MYKHTKLPAYSFMIDDPKDLPCAFLMEDNYLTNGAMIYGTVEGENLEKYKFGNEFNSDLHFT